MPIVSIAILFIIPVKRKNINKTLIWHFFVVFQNMFFCCCWMPIKLDSKSETTNPNFHELSVWTITSSVSSKAIWLVKISKNLGLVVSELVARSVEQDRGSMKSIWLPYSSDANSQSYIYESWISLFTFFQNSELQE